jgi:hypothetical protein
MSVRPHQQQAFHLSDSSLSHLDDCPGDTRAEVSPCDGRASGVGQRASLSANNDWCETAAARFRQSHEAFTKRGREVSPSVNRA